MKKSMFFMLLFSATTALSQSYPPAVGAPGSTAIFKESPLFVGWATGITVTRGYVNLSDTSMTAGGTNLASAGMPEDALGYPDGNVVSLGDRGEAIVTFNAPITDGPGFDFAVFENGGVAYLELAFVEVSSDGIHFFRFSGHSQTQTTTQLGSFGTPSATYLNNLAGKYAAQYGTPFDISELPDAALLDKQNITHVKIVDVVGSIHPDYASYDSFGNAVNDSFPTPFSSAGFDLQAVGVINQATLSTGDLHRNAVLIYPNPANGQIYIRAAQSVDMEIYDISGRIVLKKQYVKDAMDISVLSAGTYTVKITIEDRIENKRLIIK